MEPGPGRSGKKYKWVNPAAVIWVIICVIIFSLPQSPAGVPWDDEFDWKFVNYAPVTVAVVIIAVGLWWLISARHSFEGPVRQITTDETARVMRTTIRTERAPPSGRSELSQGDARGAERRSRTAPSTRCCSRSPTWRAACRASG